MRQDERRGPNAKLRPKVVPASPEELEPKQPGLDPLNAYRALRRMVAEGLVRLRRAR